MIVNTTGFTYSPGADVIGNGTAATPFRNQHTGDQDIDSGLNHVDLTWAGPVAEVQFIYKAREDRELRTTSTSASATSASATASPTPTVLPRRRRGPSSRASRVRDGARSGELVEGTDDD